MIDSERGAKLTKRAFEKSLKLQPKFLIKATRISLERNIQLTLFFPIHSGIANTIRRNLRGEIPQNRPGFFESVSRVWNSVTSGLFGGGEKKDSNPPVYLAERLSPHPPLKSVVTNHRRRRPPPQQRQQQQHFHRHSLPRPRQPHPPRPRKPPQQDYFRWQKHTRRKSNNHDVLWRRHGLWRPREKEEERKSYFFQPPLDMSRMTQRNF